MQGHPFCKEIKVTFLPVGDSVTYWWYSPYSNIRYLYYGIKGYTNIHG